ncbi:hypothetical protein RDI58_022357 [Solanum bulbocastanum]|uniref:Uncharacterized protein n=1 Tax=Solanum bulbocastanum TaxID=147425 RepID=A0AAN8T959_SOLBU
MENRKKGRQ